LPWEPRSRRCSLIDENKTVSAHISNRENVMKTFSRDMMATLWSSYTLYARSFSAVTRDTITNGRIRNPSAPMQAVRGDLFACRSTGMGTDFAGEHAGTSTVISRLSASSEQPVSSMLKMNCRGTPSAL
jgi:hypothetical protein